MAIIECSECKGKVSDTAATCPHCGAPQSKVELVAPSTNTTSAKPGGKKWSAGKILGLVFVAFIVASCIAGVNSDATSSNDSSTAAKAPEKPKPLDRIEALTMCQMLIKRAANDPEKADVPYIKGFESADSFNFKWSRESKLVRMRNGLGLDVGMPAFCSVNKETRHFTQLNIDGQDIPLK